MMSLLRICLVNLLFTTLSTNVINTAHYHVNKNQINTNLNTNNSLISFNNNYINDFNLNQENTILNVNINTSNLNTTNNINYANIYSGVFFFAPIKWTYHFTTNIPNTSITYNLNFNKLNYFNNYGNSINLDQLINLNVNVNNFISNFFSNATIKIPDLFLHACNWYKTIGDFLLTLNNQFQFTNPDFTFKSYSNINLFKLNNQINALSTLDNLKVSVFKNNLFLDLNTSNLNLSQNYVIYNVSQLDRYLASLGVYITNWDPLYSNNANVTVNLNLKNILNNYYCFNPKLLYVINTPSLLDNNHAYSTLPNLVINPNYSLLSALFKANITSELIIKLLSFWPNNFSMLSLIANLWVKHAFNWTLVNNILSLFTSNNWNYNANINNLVLNLSSVFPIDSLLNLLSSANRSLEPANWYLTLNKLADANLNFGLTSCINLYQQLLWSYKNSNIKIFFNDEQNTNINYVNNDNIFVLNQNWNYQIDLPYKYEFEINKIEYSNSFFVCSWDPNINFAIIYYPLVININSINTNNIYTNNSLNYFYLYQINNINSIFISQIAYLENTTKTNVLNQIKMFNNSLKSNQSLPIILKEYSNYIIRLDLIYSIYMLLNNNQSLYQFIISNMFYLNLFQNQNNSFISNLSFKLNTKFNTLSVTFNLNNFIQLNSNYIKFNKYLFNAYNNSLSLNFYENKSNFIIKPKKIIHIIPKSKININHTVSNKYTKVLKDKKVVQTIPIKTKNISSKKLQNHSFSIIKSKSINLFYLWILLPIFLIFFIIFYQIISWKIKVKIKK